MGCSDKSTGQAGCSISCDDGFEVSAGTAGDKTCIADEAESGVLGTASFRSLPECAEVTSATGYISGVLDDPAANRTSVAGAAILLVGVLLCCFFVIFRGTKGAGRLVPELREPLLGGASGPPDRSFTAVDWPAIAEGSLAYDASEFAQEVLFPYGIFSYATKSDGGRGAAHVWAVGNALRLNGITTYCGLMCRTKNWQVKWYGTMAKARFAIVMLSDWYWRSGACLNELLATVKKGIPIYILRIDDTCHTCMRGDFLGDGEEALFNSGFLKAKLDMNCLPPPHEELFQVHFARNMKELIWQIRRDLGDQLMSLPGLQSSPWTIATDDLQLGSEIGKGATGMPLRCVPLAPLPPPACLRLVNLPPSWPARTQVRCTAAHSRARLWQPRSWARRARVWTTTARR